MRIGKFRKALLVLALVLGQWLVVAHAFQHPALGAADQTCQLCLHAQGLDSGAVALPPALPTLVAAVEPPVSVLPARPARTRSTPCSIRGPPVLA